MDAVARKFGLDRREFGDFLHEMKGSGERGSKASGDFSVDESRDWARSFKQERTGDDPDE